MTLLKTLLAYTPYEPKVEVRGEVARQHLHVQLDTAGGKPVLRVEMHFRLRGDSAEYRIDLDEHPCARWLAPGDRVAFQWQPRHRKAFDLRVEAAADG